MMENTTTPSPVPEPASQLRGQRGGEPTHPGSNPPHPANPNLHPDPRHSTLAQSLFPSFSFLFLFASLILYLCFLYSPQNTIRLLSIQLSSHFSPSPEISHLDDWVGCSQALQSFTEFFLFILRYIRLNHMKLLFCQVKNSQIAATSCVSSNRRRDPLGVGLLSPTLFCKPCGRWG